MRRKEFERVTCAEAGIPERAAQEFLDNLAGADTELHGVMVMRSGKVCLEKWWAPYSANLVHGQQSLTKTYTGTAIGIAYTKKLLDLEERLTDIFPECIEEEDRKDAFQMQLTVRHVLCMAGGMETMPMPPGKNWVYDWLHQKIVHRPGTVFMYNMLGSSMLGEILQRKTGMGLHAFLKQELFDKIGIDASRLKWICMPDGIEMGSGGLFSTTEDNLRMMKLYLDGGVWEGERILSEEYVAQATRSQVNTAGELQKNPVGTNNISGYGYQMWMCPYQRAYRADGGMGQYAVALPDLDMLVAINQTATAVGATQTLDAIWRFADRIKGGEPEKTGCTGLGKVYEIPVLKAGRNAGEECRLQGKRHDIVQGNCSFSVGYGKGVSGMGVSEGMRSFSLVFDEEQCVITFEESGRKWRLCAGMDGKRRTNTLRVDRLPSSRVDMSAYWQSDRMLAIIARWPETCFEKELTFLFGERLVEIRERIVTGDLNTTSLAFRSAKSIGVSREMAE